MTVDITCLQFSMAHSIMYEHEVVTFVLMYRPLQNMWFIPLHRAKCFMILASIFNSLLYTIM
jgi:hypothetical protein